MEIHSEDDSWVEIFIFVALYIILGNVWRGRGTTGERLDRGAPRDKISLKFDGFHGFSSFWKQPDGRKMTRGSKFLFLLHSTLC